jgi:ABC-type transport system involved in multi-copper enzyme maturation permease subunit
MQLSLLQVFHTGILLSSTGISLFVVVALLVFAMIIIFGLSSRSLMSVTIKSEDDKSITVDAEGYDAFWDDIRHIFYYSWESHYYPSVY